MYLTLNTQSAPAAALESLTINGPTGPAKGATFGQVLQKVVDRVQSKDLIGGQLFTDIQGTQRALEGGRTLTTRELLLYQAKVGQLGLRVELLSKVAESGLSVFKRLQQG